MIIDRWDNRPTTFLKSFVLSSPLEGSPTILEDTPTHEDERTGPAARFPFPAAIYNRSQPLLGGCAKGWGGRLLLLARAVDDRTALNETNARKLYGPFLRPMSHVLGSQPMTEFGPGACTLATLGASNVTGRQSTTDGLLSSDLIRRIRHQPPTGEN